MNDNLSATGRTVRVTDPNGRELQPTWPKRAAGLVKKGRAHRVSENHIQFIDADIPSDTDTIISEEYIMSQENTAVNEQNINEQSSKAALTVEYLLAKIEKLDSDMQYLYDAIAEIGKIQTGAGPGDIAGQGKAQALADIVKCRETTKQQMLAFYTGLLDDLRTEKRKSEKQSALDIVMSVISDGTMSADERITLIEKIGDSFDTVRFIG